VIDRMWSGATPSSSSAAAVCALHLFGARLCTAASVAGVADVGDFGAIEHAAISMPRASGAVVFNERRVGFSDMG
jgi:hypothetical protein